MMTVMVDANPAPRGAYGLVRLPLYGGVRHADLATGDAHAIVNDTDLELYCGKIVYTEGQWWLITHTRMLTRSAQFLDEYGALLLEFRAANALPL